MTWIDQLKAAGFPTSVLVIDWETFFSAEYCLGKSKKALSTVEYVADPRFEPIGFGYRVLNHPWERFGSRFVPAPKIDGALNKLREVFGKSLHNVTVVCKNAKFDCLLMAEKYGIYPPFTLDVDDLLRFYDARMDHRMKTVAPLFGLQEKGDTNQFKGQHFDQIDLKAMSEYCCNDVNIEVALLQRLLPSIDNPAFELALMRHTLGLYIRPNIRYDFKLADELIAGMKDEVNKAVQDAADWVLAFARYDEREREEIVTSDCWLEIVKPYFTGDILFARMLRTALPPGESLPTKPGKPSKNMVPITGEGQILALAKDDDGLKVLLGHADPVVRALAVAHQAINSWPGHINRVEKMTRQAQCSKGFLRNPLKYYGAHTGRWSGEEGINTGNLGGSGRGKAINKLIGRVRHTMTAPEGYTFIMSDSAQIEARRLASLAGQEDLLEEFRNNGDPYSTLATQLFQERVWKPTEEEEATPEGKQAVIRRGFGKDAVLGAGYGMGAAKFYQRCMSNDTLRPLFDSGQFDRAFVEWLIRVYRTTYSHVPEFWGKVEHAWRIVTKYGHRQEVNGLIFFREDDVTYLQLPSGRKLSYRGAYVNIKDELFAGSSVTSTNASGKLWGGTLTENIVQADCRDALGLWILAVENELNRRVVHHVYDEIVVLVKEDEVDVMKPKILEIMSRCPEWARGMPYKGEAKVSPYYKK